ncbi:MAG: MarR family transcriptional regulator, partial [Thermodesulfobacteriota bacterium]|nr:MarR family transcriptional regulator [Thermodesulfobacteriota bacterium]
LAFTFNLIYQSIMEELKKEALTIPQLEIIACLNRKDGLTLSEIAGRLLVTGGNITGIVDRLEREGMVFRERDLKDRRVIRAKLTPKGFFVHKKILPIYKKKASEILQSLTKDEMRTLKHILKKISNNMKTD